MKRCDRCKQELPATSEYFDRQLNGKNGLSRYCKDCRSKARRKRAWRKSYEGILSAQAKRTMREINQRLKEQGLRICSKCKVKKPATIEFFHQQRSKKDRLRCQCKSCCNRAKRERRGSFSDGRPAYDPYYKTCPRCRWTFPRTTEHFNRDNRNRSTKDGLQVYCRLCSAYY